MKRKVAGSESELKRTEIIDLNSDDDVISCIPPNEGYSKTMKDIYKGKKVIGGSSDTKDEIFYTQRKGRVSGDSEGESSDTKGESSDTERESSCDAEEHSEGGDHFTQIVPYLGFAKPIKRRKSTSGIQVRGTPQILKDVIGGLSEVQKVAVASMGLGHILELKIEKLPTKLSLKVLECFDANECSLKVNCGTMEIDELDVSNVFGFDLGGKPLIIKGKGNGALKKSWLQQYGITTKGIYPKNLDIAQRLKDTQFVDRWFKLDFLILFYSILISPSNATWCHSNIIKCLESADDIPRFNWCKFIVQLLKESKIEWMKNKMGNYKGPIIFLTMLYADRLYNSECYTTRKWPVISYMTNEYLISRQKSDIYKNKFTNLKLLDRQFQTPSENTEEIRDQMSSEEMMVIFRGVSEGLERDICHFKKLYAMLKNNMQFQNDVENVYGRIKSLFNDDFPESSNSRSLILQKTTKKSNKTEKRST